MCTRCVLLRTMIPGVCQSLLLSRGFAVQTRLNGSRSCLGLRQLGIQGTLYGTPDLPPRIRRGPHHITVTTCFVLYSTSLIHVLASLYEYGGVLARVSHVTVIDS